MCGYSTHLNPLTHFNTVDVTKRPYVEENARERERLCSLVERLTDKELNLKIGNDWTISIALAHLAFWDQRSLFLIRKWKKTGIVEPSPIDIEVTNDSLLSLWNKLPSRSAANLAISCAELIDRELEEVSSDLVSQIENLSDKFQLYHSIHRKLHLDQIEEVLKKTS